MEAAYYDNIIEQQRIEPEFFRMGFYGRKFPFFLRVRLSKSSLVSSCPDTVMFLLMHTATPLLHASAGDNVSDREPGWEVDVE